MSLHYNGVNSYIFVNDVEIFKFKAKDSEINATPLCLGNASKDLSVDNTRKTGLYRYVYSFPVDHDSIDVVGFLDIHRYLMRKHGIKSCLDQSESIYCHYLKYCNFT